MRVSLLGLLAVVAVGCDCAGYRSTAPLEGDASLDAAADAEAVGDAGDTECRACATGELAGVELCVASDRCTFGVGEGGTFDLTLSIDRTDPIHARGDDSGPGCAECYWPTEEDPFSHIRFGIWSEDWDVRYCPYCDVGCCSPFPPTEMTLPRGEHQSSVEWPGLQWGGPSDTGEPYEDPFPPGAYSVHVAFHVVDEGSVLVLLPIQVVSR